MTPMYLYPRLEPSAVHPSLVERADWSLEQLNEVSSLRHDAVTYNPVGGGRVPQERLRRLRDDIRQIARELGYPEPLGRKTREFDQRLMRLLNDKMAIVPADAANRGVWSFLSLVLVPEIPVWRFPDRNRERLEGGPRNALQRLWWRAHVLEPERASKLSEDQLVAVMERPTLGGSILVARSLVDSILRFVANSSRGVSGDLLMRETTKRVIRLTPVVSIYSLRADQLSQLFDSIVAEVAQIHFPD